MNLWLFFIKISNDAPFAHSFGQIKAIIATVLNGNSIVISGGGDGIIRTWIFDTASNNFKQVTMLVGHTKEITSLVFTGMK